MLSTLISDLQVLEQKIILLQTAFNLTVRWKLRAARGNNKKESVDPLNWTPCLKAACFCWVIVNAYWEMDPEKKKGITDRHFQENSSLASCSPPGVLRFWASFAMQDNSLGAGRKINLWTGVLPWKQQHSPLWRTLQWIGQWQCSDFMFTKVLLTKVPLWETREVVHLNWMRVLSSCAVRLNESTGSTVTARGVSEAASVLLTACSTAWGSSRFQPRVTVRAAWFFERTRGSIHALTGKSFKSKAGPGSRSALADRLNGNVGYLMPVYSPTLDSPMLQNALILSFENFPLVTSRIILTIILSLILNLHQIVNYKLLTTWVSGEPIKTAFSYNLSRVKILFSLVRFPQKFHGWEGNVKITCEIRRGSLVAMCAAFCESLETRTVLFVSFQDNTAHAYFNMVIGNVNNKLTVNVNVC